MAGGLPLLPDGASRSWGSSWGAVQVTRRLRTREPAGTRRPPRASREHVPRRMGRERRAARGEARERAWCDRVGVQADDAARRGDRPTLASRSPGERELLEGKAVRDSKVTLPGFAGARRGGPRVGPAQAGIPEAPSRAGDGQAGAGHEAGRRARRWPPLRNPEPHGAEVNHSPAGRTPSPGGGRRRASLQRPAHGALEARRLQTRKKPPFTPQPSLPPTHAP